MPVELGVRSLDMGVWSKWLGTIATAVAVLMRLVKKRLMHGGSMTC